MIPISFPYRDMGMIWDLIDLYNFKEKEKRAEKGCSSFFLLKLNRAPRKAFYTSGAMQSVIIVDVDCI